MKQGEHSKKREKAPASIAEEEKVLRTPNAHFLSITETILGKQNRFQFRQPYETLSS